MKPNISKGMVRWLIEQNEFDLKYILWTVTKAQALVDFIVERTEKEQKRMQEEKEFAEWVIYVDGSSNNNENNARLILIGPNG